MLSRLFSNSKGNSDMECNPVYFQLFWWTVLVAFVVGIWQQGRIWELKQDIEYSKLWPSKERSKESMTRSAIRAADMGHVKEDAEEINIRM